MHSRRYHCLSCFLPWLLMFFFSLSLSLKGGKEVTFFREGAAVIDRYMLEWWIEWFIYTIVVGGVSYLGRGN